jgi:hypothetical protein
MLTRQFFLILVIPLLLCSIIDANARVSSQSSITVHQTNHTLNIIYGTGTADNAPDPCVPSLCYMSAYLHAFRLYTIYPTQSFDADNGCNNQYSADYCYGWLKAATFFHPHDGNNTRILEEAWVLGWVHTNRQNYNGKHIFYPCFVDNLFCSVYLQGEVQGYADRIEWNHNHPSIINIISRVCLGVEDHCMRYYNEHPWYSNLVSHKYDKLEKKLELKRNHAYALLNQNRSQLL